MIHAAPELPFHFWKSVLVRQFARIRHEVGNLPWAVSLLALSPLLILGNACRGAYRALLRFGFWLKWRSEKRTVLFIYSDHRHWKDYIESRILPRLGSHAVVLNRSQPGRWRGHGLEARLWTHWGGPREYSPLAIVFAPHQPAQVFRFWTPFKALHYGRERPLLNVMEDLFAAVQSASVEAPTPEPVVAQ